MIRSLVLFASLAAISLAGCEPPAVSSTAAANAPPGPPAPPAAAPLASPEQPSVPGPANFASDAISAEFASNGGADATTPPEEAPPAIPVSAESAAQPTALPLPSPTAPGDSGPFVSLSAGVAVPQLLPDGTQIGVSVDYSLRGNPKTSCRYELVVESSKGEIPVSVKLDPQGGTIQGFLPLSVRPEHQPFRARIDEVSPQGKRVRVSNSAVLATSY